MDKDKLPKVLEFFTLLSGAESAVADLYTACQEVWPGEELWKTLTEQELGHAAAALRMKELVAAAPADFLLPKPLNITGVDLFISGLKNYAAKVRCMDYTLKQALAVARDVEQSILEGRYDQFLSTKDQNYNTIIAGIIAETRGHREKINDRLATIGIVK